MERESKPNRSDDAAPEAFREAIDACRPARFDPTGGDWRLPEVAPLADEIARNPQWSAVRSRVAKFDTAIAAAVDQVPVPVGLADRLLVRLQRGAEENSGTTAHAAEVQTEAAETIAYAAARPEERRRRLLRRRWWLSGAAAALAALCVAGWWWMRPAATLDYDQLLASAKEFDQTNEFGEWKSVRKSPPQSWYALPNAIASRTAMEWQKVSNFLRRAGVAYKLTAPNGAAGTLYVVPLDGIGGLGSAPGGPQQTGGVAASAWTDGTRLYVLVVRGNERDYWGFLSPRNVA